MRARTESLFGVPECEPIRSLGGSLLRTWIRGHDASGHPFAIWTLVSHETDKTRRLGPRPRAPTTSAPPIMYTSCAPKYGLGQGTASLHHLRRIARTLLKVAQAEL